MAKSIPITFAATSIVLCHLSSAESQAVIDIEVIRETDLAVMAEFIKEDGQRSGECQWMPKKALVNETVLGEKIFIVKEWFETLDGVHIDDMHKCYGYMTEGVSIDVEQ